MRAREERGAAVAAAHDARGRITTLGRGGSDLTATVLGASVGAREVQVWKDVNGMLSVSGGERARTD